MILPISKQNQFKNYVQDALVEKYDYSIEEAKEMIDSSALIEELQKNDKYVMYFDAEFWASKISAKNKYVKIEQMC
ncbi:hypothetical protein OW763_10315 [Clostridium aestuarii]|uniref:Uncharacterized protein n=1 Tax=Clostridium aestuarii TaxID=338193 RepID=A0ABT4D0H6_9CLOT|nr:hypothetical protein [Clostridium aestuarii]MCY6484734.1 hypothetical protein [Clostridium aestuarii]